MATLGIFTVKVFYKSGSDYYTYGGFGLYLDQMCRSFDRVVMLCKLRKGPVPDGCYRVDHSNLDVITVPAWPTELGAIAVQPLVLARGLRMLHRCDVVHARMPDWNGITGAVAARLRRLPCFHQIIADWHLQAVNIPWTRAYGLGSGLRLALLFYDWMERRISRGQIVFAQGQTCFDKHNRALERYLVLSSAHHNADIGTLRSKCEGAQIRLLAVGRLQDVKNHKMLIRAMVNIRKADPRCVLRILGEGNKRPELEALLRELGLDKAVELPGQVDHTDLWREYDAADLFILPSLSEGTPKVVLEAMARGCPVIASSVGGVPTAVAHEERGLLFRSDDQAHLTKMVLRMIRDKDLRDSCQHKALDFSYQHTLEQTTAFMLDRVTRHWPALAPLRDRHA